MTGSSSKLLQIQGKWYQERKPKKHPKPEAKKKNNNYSTPFFWGFLFVNRKLLPWQPHVECHPSEIMRFFLSSPPAASATGPQEGTNRFNLPLCLDRSFHFCVLETLFLAIVVGMGKHFRPPASSCGFIPYTEAC